MYDRTYDDRVLTFEASGGLINSSLVMQDRETDSFWSIMRGRSLEGQLQGTALKEIALNEKMTWAEWRQQHPDTQVLSVNGAEDQAPAYGDYYQSDAGYRGSQAGDTRLETKTPIFAFRLDQRSYAVAHSAVIGGRYLEVGGESVFLYRSGEDGLHDSTKAFYGPDPGCSFDTGTESFSGSDCPRALTGFDTFWYNWSLNNPETDLLH